MSGLLVLRALLFAGECFLASLLLPVLAFAAAALLRRRAALRHLVWTTMFGVLAVLPFAALLLPPRLIVSRAAAPVAIDVAPVMAVPVAPAPPPSLLTPENAMALLVCLWLAGLAFQALRLGLGGLGLMRLRATSTPFAVKLETGCDVRLARGEDGPSTFGIVRPIVLLPRSAELWPAARLEAVLRHEAAHVARRDTATQLVARLVCAVFWLNPLLWLGLRCLRRDAEIAADDAVLASGMTPSLYAAELVRLAADSRGVTPGVAMAGPPLSRRVEAVLSQNSSRKGVTRMDIAKTVGLGLAATLMLGAARLDIAVAQDVAPRVEKNVDVNVGVEKSVEVQAADVRNRADAAAARARARAEAETDPAKKEQYRREAEQVAAEAERAKEDAGRMAADAARALAHAEEARKAAQDVASTQVRRAMTTRTGDPADAVAAARSLAALEQAEKAARDVATTQVGEAMRRTAADRLEAAQHMAQAFRLSEEVRQKGLQVAEARQRAEADAQRARDIAQGLRERTPLGADDGRARDGQGIIKRDNDVSIDVRIKGGASGKIMDTPEARRTLDEAIRMAVAEARTKISAAIARANAQAGVTLKAAPGASTYSYDLIVPDGALPPAPPAPFEPPALSAPPAPPAPFARPAPAAPVPPPAPN